MLLENDGCMFQLYVHVNGEPSKIEARDGSLPMSHARPRLSPDTEDELEAAGLEAEAADAAVLLQ